MQQNTNSKEYTKKYIEKKLKKIGKYKKQNPLKILRSTIQLKKK